MIAVGSTRKPKLFAVSEALEQFAQLLAPGAEIEIIGREAESGVSHTPSSRGELMRGARQRAEGLAQFAREKGEKWRYFVGLEGGLDVLNEKIAASGSTSHTMTSGPEPENARRVFLESWAYVTDGTRGHFGRSGAVEIPEGLASEVLDRGVELSEAIDRYAAAQAPDRFASASGIRNAQGAWGVLSTNLITRQEAFRVAVIAAFAPFFNPAMYRGGNLTRSATAR